MISEERGIEQEAHRDDRRPRQGNKEDCSLEKGDRLFICSAEFQVETLRSRGLVDCSVTIFAVLDFPRKGKVHWLLGLLPSEPGNRLGGLRGQL